MWKVFRIVLYVLLCWVAVTAVWEWQKRGNQSGARLESDTPPNLIIISLDTLRSDRLGLYGYERKTSPALDALGSEGAVFLNATSVTSWTLPAHLSLFTGLYPTGHGVTKDDQSKLGSDVDLLAEILQRNGYRTFGFHGGGYVSARYGFARGFEQYENTELNKQGGRRIKKKNRGFLSTIQRAKDALLSLKPEENFFLFLHTFDIHCPYNPPEPYYSMFNTPGAKKIKTNKCGDSYFNKIPMQRSQVQFVSDRYDGGIRWADENLSELLSFLKEQDRFENTLIVITSDHGEEFWEHGKIGHQRSLHRELIEIPLVLHGPGVATGRFEEMVSLVDVTPTVLELLGIGTPPEMQGRSLVPLLKGIAKQFPEHQLTELDRHITLRSFKGDSEHLIVDEDSNKRSYFEYSSDPKEQQNSWEENRKRAEEIEKEMRSFISSLEQFSTEAADPKSEEQIENLKSLGYL